MSLPAAFVRDAERLIPQDRRFTDALSTLAFGTDASFYRLIPKLVIRVESEDEVVERQSPETFANSVEELVAQTVDNTIDEINRDPSVANNAKNRFIVTQLFEKGIFDIKDSINLVADKLNISKHTVYLYIRQRKQGEEESE